MRPPSADEVPVRLPHYRVRGDGLYFLISRRPVAVLDARERAVWDSLDGVARVRDVAARFPDGVGEAALRRFVELGACLPVAADFPAARRRILVIEPHMDDGVLSVGGAMWSRREQCEFTIVTLAGRSNFTSYGYLDREYFRVDEVSELRRAESALAARALGGRHVALDLLEAPLRYHAGDWTLDWYRRHDDAVTGFIQRMSGPGELAEWTAAIRRVLDAAPLDEVWAPIGVGPHTDHELTRNAFLAVLAQDPELPRRRAVRLYQEVPYAAQFPAFTAAIVAGLERSGAVLERESVDVAGAFPDKLRLVSLFGSQFKLAAMQPRIETAARNAAGPAGGMAEVLYRVTAPPRRLDPLELSVDGPGVRRLAPRLRRWAERNRAARRVHLFLRIASGRWAEDSVVLLEAFPAARLSVWVSERARAEALETPSPRIEVRPVGRGAAAWALALLASGLRGPVPTLLVASPDRVREMRGLSALLPLCDRVVVPGMNHLALALRPPAVAGHGPGPVR
jgi:LmbE family N-acetylglucosaminyl deacetylase